MIKVLDYTKNPLTLMGTVASSCWNSNPKNPAKIALDCITSGHGRVLEFADVVIEISDYSARVIREIYTHIAGTSRLQASTRYIDYNDFNYYVPDSININENAYEEYKCLMSAIQDTYKYLLDINIPKEDIANILPFGMMSKMILKINVRAILHMAEVRECNRAYIEFREFMNELKNIIGRLDEEWNVISQYMKPKCEVYGKCNEKNSCGRYLGRNPYIQKL